MALLELLGEYEGPGEQKTAERLAKELPDRWLILAGRKLPGEYRDDVDLIVIGEHLVFVLEEKAWGPRVVADDNRWQVNGEWRVNPGNRNGQLARKVAGLLRSNVRGYDTLRGKLVRPGVVLSHDRLALVQGAHHDPTEQIYPLHVAAGELMVLDRNEPDGIHRVRDGVIGYLRGMPPVEHRTRTLGQYTITGRAEVPGASIAYTAQTAAGQAVILKCHRIAELSQYGDPTNFLERETRALNRLADLNRTWRPLPFFSSDEHGLFVVPVVPPMERRNLVASWRDADPARPDGVLPEEVARGVCADAFTALSEVHELGLLHRALHPSRVWLGRGLRVIFSDFHLARISDTATVALWADYDISEDYRAPECAANVGLSSQASDVYSLAMSLAAWVLGLDAPSLSFDDLVLRLTACGRWTQTLIEGLDRDAGHRPPAAHLAQRIAASGAPAGPAAQQLDLAPDVVVDDRYEVKRELGSGGFAQSWLVYDQHIQESKVLKAFHRDLPDEARREYQAAERLHHDRCARVYDLRLDKSPNYLVSEYVEGVNLLELDPVPSVDQLRTIASDVLDALAYIHSKDLVHGDITPRNIIVDASMHATLIDFGLSVQHGEAPAGWSPRFSAPEVRAGGRTSVAADIFGVCASLLHIMLGRDVLTIGADGQASVLQPTEAERELWGVSGTALLTVLLPGVARDPSMRPATARELLDAIQATEPVDLPVELEFVTNPTVDALRRLFRASEMGNAGNRGLDDDFAKSTYVPTLLDTALTPRIVKGDFSVVLLTGNPGDGKTSFLAKLGEHLKARGATEHHWDEAGYHLELAGRSFRAVFDASESHGDQGSDDLVMRAVAPAAQRPGSNVALVAVNDGRLRQFFDSHEDELEEMAIAVRAELDGRGMRDPRVVVVDLKRRSLANPPGADGLGIQTLAEFTAAGLWARCADCRAQGACPIVANRQLLADRGQDAFAELLLASHLRRRRRATFRDLRSAAAYILTGDRGCAEVHDAVRQGKDPRRLGEAHAYDLAFSPYSNDYLISEWSQFDPASVAAPAIDSLRRTAAEHAVARGGGPASAARAAYFGAWHTDVDRGALRAYRYLDEFVAMLNGTAPEASRARLLLGMSRLLGAFGFQEPGLAIRSGNYASDYTVLKVVPESGFTVHTVRVDSEFIETVADTLVLTHKNGPRLTLTLDTAEVILRAADGEIVNDHGSDSVLQEIEGFANQLVREPADAALIVDSTGTVSRARRSERSIVLEARR